MVQGQFREAKLLITLRDFQPRGNIRWVRFHPCTKCAQLVVPVARARGVGNLASYCLRNGCLRHCCLRHGRPRQIVVTARHPQGGHHACGCNIPTVAHIQAHKFFVTSRTSPGTVPVRSIVPTGNSRTEWAVRQSEIRHGWIARTTFFTCLSRLTYIRSRANFMKNI